MLASYLQAFGPALADSAVAAAAERRGEDPAAVPDDDSPVFLFWASRLKHPKIGARFEQIRAEGKPFILAEDAFIRSNGLGSDFYYPYSLAFDCSGIYYDATAESDLEKILRAIKNVSCYDDVMIRARNLIDFIAANRVTKYSQGGSPAAVPEIEEIRGSAPGRKVLLVVGQVDDDASILKSGCGFDSLGLLKAVREKNPDAYIVFKIHPDILSGNRGDAAARDPGSLAGELADLVCAGQYETLSLAAAADEVHTISSLAGFDALLRGKKVCTYGLPFYAGWGLTEDLQPCERRNSVGLTLEELVAGALLLYPKYYFWEKKRASRAEEICAFLTRSRPSRRNNILYGYRFIRRKILGLFGRR